VQRAGTRAEIVDKATAPHEKREILDTLNRSTDPWTIEFDFRCGGLRHPEKRS